MEDLFEDMDVEFDDLISGLDSSRVDFGDDDVEAVQSSFYTGELE